MQGAVRLLYIPRGKVVKMKKGKDKFFEAIHTIEEFCWQFRPDCKGCPLYKYYYCAIKEFMPYSEKYVRELIEEWEHEKG